MSIAKFAFRSFFDSFFAFFSLSVFSFLSFTLILTPPAAPGRFAGAATIPALPHSLVTSSPLSACEAFHTAWHIRLTVPLLHMSRAQLQCCQLAERRMTLHLATWIPRTEVCSTSGRLKVPASSWNAARKACALKGAALGLVAAGYTSA